MVQKAPVAAKETEAVTHQRALLFELENVALDGWTLKFDCVKAALKSQRIELTQPLFARYCLTGTAERYLPNLLQALGKGTDQVDTVATAISSNIKKTYGSATLTMNADLKSALKQVADLGGPVGALSYLDEETAQAVAEKLGLRKQFPELELIASNNANGSDPWSRLARNLDINPRLCIVMGTHVGSCRAALSAHMRFIAVPSALTAFQDFSGADFVLDSPNADLLSEMLSLS